MIGLPTIGEPVKFRSAEGRRVPMIGRPGRYYAPGAECTETWTMAHYARLREGAIVLVEWSGMPPAGPGASAGGGA